ncbi:carboxylate--amine ligase, partial [Leptospira ellisii]
DLITETLTAKIDEISRTFDGFYFGRYDIRYRSDESFKEGKNFGIVELNGITSESTNLYDPEFGIFRKYSVLFGQWNLLFRIGWENRKRGIEKTSLYEIAKTLLEYYSTDKKIDDRSD